MASVALASFWWRTVSKSETHFLWQASRDELAISRCTMVLFISSWSEITSSGRAPVSVPGVLVGRVVGAQTTSGVLSMGLMSSGVAVGVNTWEEVATGITESSVLAEGEAPRAGDVGLFWVEPPNAWLEVFSTACDRSSQMSAVMLMWLSALGGHSIVRWEEEVGVEVLQGAEAMGTWSPGVTLERSTCRNAGLWADSLKYLHCWLVILIKKLAPVPSPCLVLQGMPCGPHTARVCVLLSYRAAHMHFC